jgi:hypothetical protein
METRRDLIGEFPVLKQISAPNTDKDDDKDTFIPIHPGAAAYFDGTQKSFLDKYGDQFMYGSMVLGSLASIFAAAWKFMTKKEDGPESLPLMRLYAFKDQLSKAGSEAELAEAEQRVDEIFKSELEKHARGDAEATDTPEEWAYCRQQGPLAMSAFVGKAGITVTLILPAQAMWYHSKWAQTGGRTRAINVELVDV